MQIHKKSSKRNISAEKRVLYGKLGQYQKIREITAGHLYQGLGQSPQSFLMFEKEQVNSRFTGFNVTMCREKFLKNNKENSKVTYYRL